DDTQRTNQDRVGGTGERSWVSREMGGVGGGAGRQGSGRRFLLERRVLVRVDPGGHYAGCASDRYRFPRHVPPLAGGRRPGRPPPLHRRQPVSVGERRSVLVVLGGWHRGDDG